MKARPDSVAYTSPSTLTDASAASLRPWPKPSAFDALLMSSSRYPYPLAPHLSALGRRIALAFLGMSAVACIANSPPAAPPPAPRDYWVAAPLDKVWGAAVQSVADNGAPIAAIDRVSGFLRTGDMRLSRAQAQQWLDCGRDGSGTPFAGHPSVTALLSYTLLLRGDGDSTAVRPQVSGRAWNAMDARLMAQGNMFAQNPNLECVSLGVLEQLLVSATATRAGAPPVMPSSVTMQQDGGSLVAEDWMRVIAVARTALLESGASDVTEPIVGEVSGRLPLEPASAAGLAECSRGPTGQAVLPNSLRYTVKVDAAGEQARFRVEAALYPSPQCRSTGAAEDRLRQRMLALLARRP